MGHLFDNLAQFEEEAAARRRASCRVHVLLAAVRADEGDDAVDKLRGLIENPSVGMDPLCAVIRNNGYTLGRESLRRHRAGLCPCAHEESA